MSVDPDKVGVFDMMSFNGFLADALNITVTSVLDNVENGIEEIKLLARPREFIYIQAKLFVNFMDFSLRILLQQLSTLL